MPHLRTNTWIGIERTIAGCQTFLLAYLPTAVTFTTLSPIHSHFLRLLLLRRTIPELPIALIQFHKRREKTAEVCGSGAVGGRSKTEAVVSARYEKQITWPDAMDYDRRYFGNINST